MQSIGSINKVKLGQTKAVNRVEYILAHCQPGKSILHLGCVDSPFIEARVAKGLLLHQRLSTINPDVTGVDLDSGGIEFMRCQLGFKNLYEGNIEKLDELGLSKKFDVVLAPEIIEHINNPGLFFSAALNVLENNGQLVITVPNSLFVKNFIHAIFRRENVHPDHNFYFSPVTLKHLVESNGFSVLEIFPYWSQPRRGVVGVLDRIISSVKYLSAWLGDGLVVCAVPVKK